MRLTGSPEHAREREGLGLCVVPFDTIETPGEGLSNSPGKPPNPKPEDIKVSCAPETPWLKFERPDVHIYIYIYTLYTHISYIYIYVCVCIYVCMYVCMYACAYVYTYTCTNQQACLSVFNPSRLPFASMRCIGSFAM